MPSELKQATRSITRRSESRQEISLDYGPHTCFSRIRLNHLSPVFRISNHIARHPSTKRYLPIQISKQICYPLNYHWDYRTAWQSATLFKSRPRSRKKSSAATFNMEQIRKKYHHATRHFWNRFCYFWKNNMLFAKEYQQRSSIALSNRL